MPADSNANGDIFGGWVMAQVDLAGSVLPARYIKGRMATVAVNEFIFKQPVRVGDILSFFAAVTRIGRTSITVEVEVYAERFSDQGKYLKVTEARLTYVAQAQPRSGASLQASATAGTGTSTDRAAAAGRALALVPTPTAISPDNWPPSSTTSLP